MAVRPCRWGSFFVITGKSFEFSCGEKSSRGCTVVCRNGHECARMGMTFFPVRAMVKKRKNKGKRNEHEYREK